MKLYYLERKTFYISPKGVDHQCADGGELPYLFKDLKKADERMHKISECMQDIYGYELLKEEHDLTFVPDGGFYRLTLIRKKDLVRYTLTIYQIETKD